MFDERIAARYETYWPELFEPAAIDPVVSFLAGLAGDGRVLELGVGTGRLALPLTRRGVPVHGIEFVRADGGPAAGSARRGSGRRHDRRHRHHHWVIDGQTETFSSPHRYLWPSELDLMARIAGLTLRERWGSWQREPFTSDSSAHISVWEKPTGVAARH